MTISRRVRFKHEHVRAAGEDVEGSELRCSAVSVDGNAWHGPGAAELESSKV